MNRTVESSGVSRARSLEVVATIAACVGALGVEPLAAQESIMFLAKDGVSTR